MTITNGNHELGRSMRWHRLILALLALVAGGVAQAQAVPDHWPRCPADLPDRYSVQALRHERNDDRLFCAAIDVARNDDPLALRVLSAVMSEPPFVARLGPSGHPAQDWQALRLVAVLRALAANDSTAAARLCAAWHTEPTMLHDAARAQAVQHTLSACAPSASAPPAPKPASMEVTEPLADTVERLVPSVVRVTALRLQAGAERASESVFGTGFLVDASGLLATNYHVIKNASAVHVTFANHDDYQVSIVGTDPVSDIALLRIESTDVPAQGLPSAPPVAAVPPRVGDEVITIGTPYRFFSFTVTRGIVSATGRVTSAPVPLIQTDLRINVGNSGGPLFDRRGEVVGMMVQSFGPTRTSNTGINFAIPANTVARVLATLRRGQRVDYPLLGADLQAVTYARAEEAQYRGVDGTGRKRVTGAWVEAVLPDTPAERAGLREGDIITHFDRQPVWVYTELVNLVGAAEPNSQHGLEVVRDGEVQQLPVLLDVLR